jgi:hypothetical protein
MRAIVKEVATYFPTAIISGRARPKVFWTLSLSLSKVLVMSCCSSSLSLFHQIKKNCIDLCGFLLSMIELAAHSKCSLPPDCTCALSIYTLQVYSNNDLWSFDLKSVRCINLFVKIPKTQLENATRNMQLKRKTQLECNWLEIKRQWQLNFQIFEIFQLHFWVAFSSCQAERKIILLD